MIFEYAINYIILLYIHAYIYIFRYIYTCKYIYCCMWVRLCVLLSIGYYNMHHRFSRSSNHLARHNTADQQGTHIRPRDYNDNREYNMYINIFCPVVIYCTYRSIYSEWMGASASSPHPTFYILYRWVVLGRIYLSVKNPQNNKKKKIDRLWLYF